MAITTTGSFLKIPAQREVDGYGDQRKQKN
jgi:hypothetical protein